MPRSNSSGPYSSLPSAALSHLWSLCASIHMLLPTSLATRELRSYQILDSPTWHSMCCSPRPAHSTLFTSHPSPTRCGFGVHCSPKACCTPPASKQAAFLGKPSLMLGAVSSFLPSKSLTKRPPFNQFSKHDCFYTAPFSLCHGYAISQTTQSAYLGFEGFSPIGWFDVKSQDIISPVLP